MKSSKIGGHRAAVFHEYARLVGGAANGGRRPLRRKNRRKR
jgi:hypothetical protein